MVIIYPSVDGRLGCFHTVHGLIMEPLWLYRLCLSMVFHWASPLSDALPPFPLAETWIPQPLMVPEQDCFPSRSGVMTPFPHVSSHVCPPNSATSPHVSQTPLFRFICLAFSIGQAGNRCQVSSISYCWAHITTHIILFSLAKWESPCMLQNYWFQVRETQFK